MYFKICSLNLRIVRFIDSLQLFRHSVQLYLPNQYLKVDSFNGQGMSIGIWVYY